MSNTLPNNNEIELKAHKRSKKLTNPLIKLKMSIQRTRKLPIHSLLRKYEILYTPTQYLLKFKRRISDKNKNIYKKLTETEPLEAQGKWYEDWISHHKYLQTRNITTGDR